MIARHHDDLDSCGSSFGKSGRNLAAHGIEEGDETDEGEWNAIGLDRKPPGDRTLGHAENA